MDLFSLFKEKVDDKGGDLLKIFSNLVEFFNSLPSYIDDKLPSLLLEGYQNRNLKDYILEFSINYSKDIMNDENSCCQDHLSLIVHFSSFSEERIGLLKEVSTYPVCYKNRQEEEMNDFIRYAVEILKANIDSLLSYEFISSI